MTTKANFFRVFDHERFQTLSVATITSWFLIVFGIILRLDRFLFNRSLWLDEAWIALNIIRRPVASLLQPLDYNQAAPVGWIIGSKLSVKLLGNTEYALRLLPLLSGIASLFLIYIIARHYLPNRVIPIAVGLFAITEHAIYYAGEVKQYSSDVTITLAILWLVSKLRRGNITIAFAALYVIASTAFIWFSFPAVFVLAGVTIALMIQAYRKQDRKMLFTVIAVSIGWAASFILYYLLVLRQNSSNEFLLDYWQRYFLPLNATLPDWLIANFFNLFTDPGGLLSVAAGLAFALGIVQLIRKDRSTLTIITLPLLVTLAVSMVEKYPFGSRTMLFAVPLLLIVIAYGVDYLIEKTWSLTPVIAILAIGFLFTPPLVSVFQAPKTHEELRDVMSYLSTHHLPGDVIYVYYSAQPAFDYYAARFGFHEGEYIVGVKARGSKEVYKAQISALNDQPRVWAVFSHPWGDEESFLTRYFDSLGKLKDKFLIPGPSSYIYSGASLYLFDMR